MAKARESNVFSLLRQARAAAWSGQSSTAERMAREAEAVVRRALAAGDPLTRHRLLQEWQRTRDAVAVTRAC